MYTYTHVQHHTVNRHYLYFCVSVVSALCESTYQAHGPHPMAIRAYKFGHKYVCHWCFVMIAQASAPPSGVDLHPPCMLGAAFTELQASRLCIRSFSATSCAPLWVWLRQYIEGFYTRLSGSKHTHSLTHNDYYNLAPSGGEVNKKVRLHLGNKQDNLWEAGPMP